MTQNATQEFRNRQLLKQRTSATVIAVFGTATGALVAIIQLTYVFGLADPGLFSLDGVRFSGFLNLLLFPIGLAFYAVNELAKRKWPSHEVIIYRVSLFIFLTALLLQGLGHVHNAGLANSAISGYFIMIVTLAAWFLPRSEFRAYIVITIIAGTTLALLETSGAIAYAPIFAESDHIAHIFLSPEIIFGSFAMVVIWTVLIGWIVRYVRRRLEQSNIELERKVAERSAELERAREDEAVLRERLAHVSKVASLGELTASLAHELNQPLAAILNNASAGRRMTGAVSPDLQAIGEVFRDIADDDRRAAEAIQTLRRLFRFGEMKREPVSIQDIVRDVLILTKGEAARHDIILQSDLKADLPLIRADRVQLDHLLLNLVRNAIEALKPLERGIGRTTIAARPSGEAVVLEIRDNGPGFDPDLLPQLFDSFVTTKSNGLGIGLSLCRTIVRRHGGDITASNQATGGAVVQVTLPMEADGEPL